MTDAGSSGGSSGSAPADLRPIERAVRKLAAGGMADAEIAWRLRRTPGYVARLQELTKLRRGPQRVNQTSGFELRPIERCILRARRRGTTPAEIAARFRRSPGYVLRVERFAKFKEDRQRS